MKTLAKTTIASAIALMMTITNGCKKEDLNNVANAGDMPAAKAAAVINMNPQLPGTLELKMISTPAKGLGGVNVEITEVLIHYANETMGTRGWVAVPAKDNVYDLQEFHDGKYVVLGVNNKMPAGKINEIRLVIGQKNTVVKGDADGRHSYPLTVTGANHNANLRADMALQKANRLVVTVDFNAQKSVNYEGEGTYILTPALGLKDIEYIPMISNQ